MSETINGDANQMCSGPLSLVLSFCLSCLKRRAFDKLKRSRKCSKLRGHTETVLITTSAETQRSGETPDPGRGDSGTASG